jgi:hypothetical protein
MSAAPAAEFYVSPDGADGGPGTRAEPFASLARAQAAARQAAAGQPNGARVVVRAGAYYLDATLAFEPDDSGVTYVAYPGEQVTLSGGRRLECHWRPFHDGIWQCDLPAAGRIAFTQLFINGKRQVRARYPNYDPSDPKHYTGYLPAAGRLGDELVAPYPGPDDDMTFSSGAPRGIRLDPAHFASRRWARPDEAVIHIYQSHYWGNLQWRVKHIDWDQNVLWFGRGGQQMGAKWHAAPCDVSERSRFFIENVFEELDAPGEWYLDSEQNRLYFWPPAGVDLAAALVEVPQLQQLVRIVGAPERPVRGLALEGFRFAHTAATFLEPYCVPSLSDWAIHRGGSVFMQDARECAIRDCFFDAVGGNAIFMNDYNRGNTVSGCRFTEAGDSAVCLVGSLETTVGTQRNFPYECRVENNLIHDCGVFGKQVAGIYISRARRITAAHNEIYSMPRAGICLGDGTWGGHIVEYNHIHNTCRETGDHGPFNAWGRDRYWCLVQSHSHLAGAESHSAGPVKIDAMEPTILHHNFFEEETGWGLDLDDGASNYEIYNNLCVGVSLKLREGAYRTIYNNIWVNGANSPCFHVGNADNHDRYFRNITVMSTARMKPEMDLDFDMGNAFGEIYTLIAPPAQGPWLEEIDHNCFYSDLGTFVARARSRGAAEGRKYSLDEWQALGFDQHSIFADPLFVDPSRGDYRVRPESPALKVGFENFDMAHVGLIEDFPDRWREPSTAA